MFYLWSTFFDRANRISPSGSSQPVAHNGLPAGVASGVEVASCVGTVVAVEGGGSVAGGEAVACCAPGVDVENSGVAVSHK